MNKKQREDKIKKRNNGKWQYVCDICGIITPIIYSWKKSWYCEECWIKIPEMEKPQEEL